MTRLRAPVHIAGLPCGYSVVVMQLAFHCHEMLQEGFPYNVLLLALYTEALPGHRCDISFNEGVSDGENGAVRLLAAIGLGLVPDFANKLHVDDPTEGIILGVASRTSTTPQHSAPDTPVREAKG